jgi:hypothetical protein
MRLIVLVSSLLFLVPLQPGCIIGPTADVAANGVVLAAPSNPAVTPYVGTFQAGVALARPVSITDLESNLVDATSVWLEVDGAIAELSEEGTGLYAYDGSPVALPEGAEVTLFAVVDGVRGSVSVAAPAPPDLSALPTDHDATTDVVIDLRGLDIALAYGTLIDQTGSVVYDDRPADADDVLLDLKDAREELNYVFPSEVLEAGRAYTMALTVIRTAEGPDYDNLEAFWSNYGVGAVGAGVLVTGI